MIELPGPLREALALHELLRRLEFRAEDIFLSTSPTPQGQVQVVLRSAGREFRCDVGAQGMPRDRCVALWQEAAAAWNGGGGLTHEERVAIFHGSEIYGRAWELVLALSRKGLPPPAWGAAVPWELSDRLQRPSPQRLVNAVRALDEDVDGTEAQHQDLVRAVQKEGDR